MEIKSYITFKQAKEIDFKTIEKGVTEKILMGLAAQSVNVSLYHLGLLNKDYEYIFLCGRGNNGGDALAIAYLLKGYHYDLPIKIYLQDNPRSEASLFFYHQLLKNNYQIEPIENFLKEETFHKQKIIIIEGLLGTGQQDLPKGIFKDVLEKIQKLKKNQRVVHIALDLPAGLSEEYQNFNLQEYENFFGLPIPDYIFNFGITKLALGLHPLLNAKSKIISLPCGFDPVVQKEVMENQTRFIFLEKDENFQIFQKRNFDHKYSAGYSWIIAGNRDMEGAALLSSKSFFAAGGGILHLIHPYEPSKKIFLSVDPSIILHSFDNFFSNVEKYKIPDTIGIGPGLDKSSIKDYYNFFIKLFKYLADSNKIPWIILDAYATQIVLDKEYPEKLKKNTIITPHVGEWLQMGGDYPFLVSSLNKVIEFANSLGISVLIKGSISLFIPSPQIESNRFYIWNHQNANLAVAGSGDVLTGLFCAGLKKVSENFTLLSLIRKILTLQNQSSAFHSTAFIQVKNIKKILKNS